MQRYLVGQSVQPRQCRQWPRPFPQQCRGNIGNQLIHQASLQQRADLNDRVATVREFVSGEGKTARRSVVLGGSDECISVKAANLRRHPRQASAQTLAPPSSA